jgi:hypothetical protein
MAATPLTVAETLKMLMMRAVVVLLWSVGNEKTCPPASEIGLVAWVTTIHKPTKQKTAFENCLPSIGAPVSDEHGAIEIEFAPTTVGDASKPHQNSRYEQSEGRTKGLSSLEEGCWPCEDTWCLEEQDANRPNGSVIRGHQQALLACANSCHRDRELLGE